MGRLFEMQQCTTETCTENGVIALAGNSLCLEHFFEECYERLEKYDPQVRCISREMATLDGTPMALEELVKRVLIVCLQHENLSNLDRSRLLDILLWAGELQFLLRVPRSVSPNTIMYGPGERRRVAARSLSGNRAG
jgi:hypothetical protein